MDLVLNRFGHYFSIEGRKGGLSSTVWHFLPAPDTDPEEATAGMKAALGFHADTLDRLFASVFRGRRTESLSDSAPSPPEAGGRITGAIAWPRSSTSASTVASPKLGVVPSGEGCPEEGGAAFLVLLVAVF